jgi:prolyl-tRNA editing enzyme YbaK/EbsC (Cys-tRNA(Pro) deacylase)
VTPLGPQDFVHRAAQAGFKLDVQELAASTRTAQDAALAVGCSQRQIVKSLVFLADGEPVIVLQRGDRRVDPDRLRTVLGAEKVKRADADTANRETGYAIGGVPPFGHLRELRTVLDACIADDVRLFAAAGGPSALFETYGDELRRASQAQVACCCAEAD